MHFVFTNEQLEFQKMVKNFARDEIAPHARQWDKEYHFPLEILRKAAGLGLAGLYVQNDMGGSNLSRLDSVLIFEALATACVSTAAYLSIHNMVASIIDRHASLALRQKWLPQLTTMEMLGSYCLTEPNSGSDAASLQTTAIKEGDIYRVNGAKAFISGGSSSDIYVCMVRTDGESAKGISCLLIEKNTPGLSFGKKESKLGWHNQPTTMVFFENCEVPTSNLIGLEGEGFKIALSALNSGRINIAACSLGGAQECLRLSKIYLEQREQFHHKLIDFQTVQFKLADMLTELEASRLLVWRAAAALDMQQIDAPLYCAMAKRYATDACFDIANQALQLHGGYGYLEDYGIERYFRDLRVHSILEGSNEIMRLIIARHILSLDPNDI